MLLISFILGHANVQTFAADVLFGRTTRISFTFFAAAAATQLMWNQLLHESLPYNQLCELCFMSSCMSFATRLYIQKTNGDKESLNLISFIFLRTPCMGRSCRYRLHTLSIGPDITVILKEGVKQIHTDISH